MSKSLFDDWPDDFEAQFWKQYPLKVGKIAALKALRKVRERGDIPWASIMAAISRYSAWLDQRGPNCWRPEPKHPATWLNQGCWDDEYPVEAPRGPSLAQRVFNGYQGR